MNATLISKEKTAVKLSFEVSAEVLEQGMAFAYNKHKNNLSLPGFRKGKVPRKLIEAQYRNWVWTLFPLPLWILTIFSPARAQNSSAM